MEAKKLRRTYYDQTLVHHRIPNAILGAVKGYLARIIYTEDTLEDAKSRIFLGTVDDVNEARRQAKNETKTSNLSLPFTAYAIQDRQIREEKKSFQSGQVGTYSTVYGMRIYQWPILLEVPTVTIFSNVFDYQIASDKLEHAFSNPVKLKIPIRLRDQELTITIIVVARFQHGQYAYDFREHKLQGDYWDKPVTLEIRAHNLSTVDLDDLVVPVEEVIFRMFFLPEAYEDSPDQVLTNPRLLEALPATAATGVPVNVAPVFRFSTPILPESVDLSFASTLGLRPVLTWSEDHTELTITPQEPLQAQTLYEIQFSVNADYQQPAVRVLYNFETA